MSEYGLKKATTTSFKSLPIHQPLVITAFDAMLFEIPKASYAAQQIHGFNIPRNKVKIIYDYMY
jgi:hypothetical protein